MNGVRDILQISGLRVSYGAIQALHGVSLNVPQGKIVTLIGANGAGKSTVLRAISGLAKIQQGSIVFKGEDLAGVAAHDIVKRGLLQCPEGRGVFPNLSVEENLDLGAYTRSDAQEIHRDLAHVFELFPRLMERRGQAAGTLSGGEQQMLAIGRALMGRPQLLLLDEPSLGLAPQVVEMIFSTVKRINGEGTSILLVEQNANLALETADYAYVLETGSILLQGNAAKVAADKRVKEAYLGT
jgi:branched-chain amino acid transport system ATP-binding protein